ncbi:MAG: hypothetical protein LBQ49_00045 [Rickettsiales bacterium]|nr:hypothetical protein [Rickettsiales bacterium]
MSKIISITGPDGSGKSFLTYFFMDNYKGSLIHATHRENPESGCVQHMEFIDRALSLQKWGNVVLDRNWICTLVYENIFHDDGWRNYIDKYLDKNMDILLSRVDAHVVCIPERNAYFKRFEELKSERRELYTNMNDIYDAYQSLWHGVKQDKIKSKIFNEIIGKGGLKTFPGFYLYDYTNDGKDMKGFIEKILISKM